MLLLPAWTSKWLPWRTFLWALARLRKGVLDVAFPRQISGSFRAITFWLLPFSLNDSDFDE
jgi:hypothetical protein